MRDPLSVPVCWAVSEGHAGMENQALGLAEALGLTVARKAVAARLPWRRLPPSLWLTTLGFRALKGDALAPPWPSVVIGSGGQGAYAAALIRRASGGAAFAIQIQTPRLPARAFDVMVVPRHDGVTGPNVIVTDGAIHRVTRTALASAEARFGPRFAHLPHPRVAVLIGGSNRRYRLPPARMQTLAAQLAALANAGAGLMVTPSRRTEPAAAAILRTALSGKAEIWDGTGDNPYLGFLALADAILVTRDSVSMTSEAAFTGKPVHVIDLDGHSRRIERFHDHMQSLGCTRRFTGALEQWRYTPPDDTGMAAAHIHPLLEAHLQRTAA